jgi:hypothetical protein
MTELMLVDCRGREERSNDMSLRSSHLSWSSVLITRANTLDGSANGLRTSTNANRRHHVTAPGYSRIQHLFSQRQRSICRQFWKYGLVHKHSLRLLLYVTFDVLCIMHILSNPLYPFVSPIPPGRSSAYDTRPPEWNDELPPYPSTSKPIGAAANLHLSRLSISQPIPSSHLNQAASGFVASGLTPLSSSCPSHWTMPKPISPDVKPFASGKKGRTTAPVLRQRRFLAIQSALDSSKHGDITRGPVASVSASASASGLPSPTSPHSCPGPARTSQRHFDESDTDELVHATPSEDESWSQLAVPPSQVCAHYIPLPSCMLMSCPAQHPGTPSPR